MIRPFSLVSLSYPIFDDLVKSLKTVTPAEAGVQNYLNSLNSRFRGNDKNGEIGTFYETIIFGIVGYKQVYEKLNKFKMRKKE